MGWRIEMRIAVCDDDQNFCKEMLKYLQGYFKEKKLKQADEKSIWDQCMIISANWPRVTLIRS